MQQAAVLHTENKIKQQHRYLSLPTILPVPKACLSYIGGSDPRQPSSHDHGWGYTHTHTHTLAKAAACWKPCWFYSWRQRVSNIMYNIGKPYTHPSCIQNCFISIVSCQCDSCAQQEFTHPPFARQLPWLKQPACWELSAQGIRMPMRGLQ